MAIRIFNLRGVPDDEADEIRALLSEQEIDFYETPAGSWGMSMPSLWLKDESQSVQARQLLEDYQRQRQQQVQADYERLKQQGGQRRVFDMIREEPIRYLLYLIIIAVVIYFSVSPFIRLG